MVCGNFILPEACKPCLFLSAIQFAQLILPYPEFVGGQCASRRLLLKPPSPSKQGRHSLDIRNGGLDVTQNRRSTLKIHYGRMKLPALQRFFSFPVWRGRIAWLIRFILLLCGCLFQPVKTLITDDVFNPAGIGLRSFGSTPAAISCSVKKQ